MYTKKTTLSQLLLYELQYEIPDATQSLKSHNNLVSLPSYCILSHFHLSSCCMSGRRATNAMPTASHPFCSTTSLIAYLFLCHHILSSLYKRRELLWSLFHPIAFCHTFICLPVACQEEGPPMQCPQLHILSVPLLPLSHICFFVIISSLVYIKGVNYFAL